MLAGLTGKHIAMTGRLGGGPALAYALVSRLMFTVSDLSMAGIAAIVGVIARKREGAYRGELPPE